MPWRGKCWFAAAVGGMAAAACAPPFPDGADLDGSVARTPAAPSTTPDAGPTANDAGNASDAPASDDAPPIEDASASDASDASVEPCPTKPYCTGKQLVTPTAGRMFCSKKSVFCQFGCIEVEAGGAACATFDPASCPDGVPWESATKCPYLFQGLCFESITAACECANCGTNACVGGKLKFPKPLDGGLPPNLPSPVSCQP